MTVEQLQALLRGESELALIDVRDEAQHAEGHILAAALMPARQLEALAPTVLPRKGVAIVLVDDGDGVLATSAAHKLRRMGYDDVSVLAGGMSSWAAHGLEVFRGINVLGRVLAGSVEITKGTPSITADEVKAALEQGEEVVVLDARPFDEYHEMSLPAGVDCPGVELPYRFREVVHSDVSLVVVNCAGRTRAILGAQALIDARVPNPVAWMRDGTMGWELAGHDLERWRGDVASAPGDSAWTRAVAAELRDRFDLSFIDRLRLTELEDQAESRTLYLIDVRQPGEYASGHAPGARNVPGDRLITRLKSHVPVRNARIVLFDGGDLVRAATAASWLVQLGWGETHVFEGELETPAVASEGESRAPSDPAGGPRAAITDPPEDPPVPPIGAPWQKAAESARLETFAEYLAWEQRLVEQARRDGSVKLRIPPPGV